MVLEVLLKEGGDRATLLLRPGRHRVVAVQTVRAVGRGMCSGSVLSPPGVSRRVSAVLKAQGLAAGRCRTRRLLRQQGLKVGWRRKLTLTTQRRHDFPVAGNILDRKFKPEAMDRAWVADINYIHTARCWLYLAAVMDLYSRKIVGWATAASMPAELAARP